MNGNRMTTHWHYGHNLAGYLPESDVGCVQTREDAAVIISFEIKDYAKSDDDMTAEDIQETVPAHEQEVALEEVCMLAHAQAILKDDEPDSYTGDWSTRLTDGAERLIEFWIMEVSDLACDHSLCENQHDETEWPDNA